MHGGSAPQVIHSAHVRLIELAEGPAIDALERALRCRDAKAMVRAATDLLDRAGLGVKYEGALSLNQVGRLLTVFVEGVKAEIFRVFAADPDQARDVLGRIQGSISATLGVPDAPWSGVANELAVRVPALTPDGDRAQ